MGVVIGIHGLRGDLKVRVLPTGDVALQGAIEVYLKNRNGSVARFRADRILPHKKIILLRLSGLPSPEAAKVHVGSKVCVRSDELPLRSDDLFYWHELEGLEVFDDNLGYLGRVTGMFSTPAHDIIEVEKNGSDIMIPAVPQFLKGIDHKLGQLLVTLPEGLVSGPKKDGTDDPV